MLIEEGEGVRIKLKQITNNNNIIIFKDNYNKGIGDIYYLLLLYLFLLFNIFTPLRSQSILYVSYHLQYNR